MRRYALALLVTLTAVAATAAEPLVARVVVYQRLARIVDGNPELHQDPDMLLKAPDGGWPASFDEVRALLSERRHNTREVMIEEIFPAKLVGGAENTDFFVPEQQRALELKLEGDSLAVLLPKTGGVIPINVPATPNVTHIFGAKDEMLYFAVTLLPASAAKDDTIVILSGGKPLQLISRVDPTYPRIEELRNRTGTVFTELKVLPDGTVAAVNILQHTHPQLDTAIADAYKQWRFQPPTRNGKPVVAYMFIVATWHID